MSRQNAVIKAAVNLYDNRLGHRDDNPTWKAPQSFWRELAHAIAALQGDDRLTGVEMLDEGRERSVNYGAAAVDGLEKNEIIEFKRSIAGHTVVRYEYFVELADGVLLHLGPLGNKIPAVDALQRFQRLYEIVKQNGGAAPKLQAIHTHGSCILEVYEDGMA